MRATIRTAAMFILVLVVPAAAAAQALHSLGYSSPADIERAIGLGAVVRHIGAREVVLEGTPGLSAELRVAGAVSEALRPVRRGEELYLCYPRGSVAVYAAVGEVLWSDTDGAAIVVTDPGGAERLRPLSFSVAELPGSIDVGEWFDNSPAPPVNALAGRDAAEVRGAVEDALSAVSTDSLMGHIRSLSEHPDGSLRCRYAYREEGLTEAKPYIVSKLEDYLPPEGVVWSQAFTRAGYSCEGDHSEIVDYPIENIVGVLPGTGRLDGHYVVCAHYDATAVNSYEPDDYFWWCDSATPGADDNATGVATVLEAARILSDMSFPFDIRFILFGSEELGLIGSSHYAEAAADSGDTVYGVFNVDMVAYKLAESNPDTCHLVTNPGTAWLVDWTMQTADEYPSHFENFNPVRIDKSLAYSDHASFWTHGYDGFVAIEHWNPRTRNPYYHTLRDTIATVSESQLASTARLVIGSLARMADPEGTINLAVFEGDIAFDPAELWTGTPTDVRVDVHVFGPEESVDMTLEVWDGDPDDSELLSTYSVERTMGGGEVITHDFVWDLAEGDLGNHTITARVLTESTQELALSDNETSVEINVSVPGEVYVAGHYVAPNPVRPGQFPEFHFELSREAGGIDLDVYDLTGQKVTGMSSRNVGPPGTPPLLGTAAGDNAVTWDDMESSPPLPASGIYLYRLAVYESGEDDPAAEETGKFAIVR